MAITDSKLLKQLYNAFDAFPLEAKNPKDHALYVDCQAVRGDSNILAELGTHIEWSDSPTCQLYAGHRGAGKSTELLRLRRYLEERGYHVVYFAADEGDIDPEDARYTDILLSCTRQLLDNLRQTDPAPLERWLKNCWSALKDFAQTEISVEVQGEMEVPLAFAKLTANLSGSPSARKTIRDQVDPHTVSLLDALNAFIGEAGHDGVGDNRLVLIADNLDRIVPIYNKDTGRTNHEEIFLDRSEQLTALNCHVIYTVPISLVYSEHGTLLEDRYENLSVLPMITVQQRGRDRAEYPPGLDTFRDLLEKRTRQAVDCNLDQVFDDRQVVADLCRMSGGHLRNLMQLAQGTLRNLPVFRGDGRQAAARSIVRMRETYISAIDEEDWARLASVYLSQQMPNEQDYRDLLFNRSILEYRHYDGVGNPKWQDVHPLVVDIEQFQRALRRQRGEG